MNTDNTKEHIYYDENPLLARNRAAVFSYSHDAEHPLFWIHYSHRQLVAQHTSIHKNEDWCSMFVFLSGNISFLIDNHMYTPNFGDAIILHDHENYTSIFPEVSNLDYYQFYFPQEFFGKAKTGDLFIKPFYDRKASEKNLISPSEENRMKLIEHLKSLDAICKSGSERGDILMYSHVIQIMEIYHSAFTAQPKASEDTKIPNKLNKAIIYIHNNFTTLEGVSEVARMCNVSNAYLARIFKAHLSCTPNEYITFLRISHAKYLLSTGESITDTCYKSGFNNYTYFISKFKQITGTTPSKFNKKEK
ncbi:MAG: helix-turn-helix transcriptional regulator [Ruminococcaceae bacterium]|nr:helix-turn-helix transcriptional regulator [Oscillospiraceae bacterium]